MIEPSKAAILLIDMQNGFIDPTSALCVAGAAATVPACAHALDHARRLGMAVFHVRRSYRADGADVEPCRYAAWKRGGRPLSPASADAGSMNWPDLLTPADGDRVLVKPRFSAFFGTPLHDVLSREGVKTVVLAGTTTPNCIRSTCYDALSLNYNVVVLEDATSSRTPEVQRANIEDMAFIGAHVMSVAEFCERGLEEVPDTAGDAARDIAREQQAAAMNGGAGAPESAGEEAQGEDARRGQAPRALPPIRKPRSSR